MGNFWKCVWASSGDLVGAITAIYWRCWVVYGCQIWASILELILRPFKRVLHTSLATGFGSFKLFVLVGWVWLNDGSLTFGRLNPTSEGLPVSLSDSGPTLTGPNPDSRVCDLDASRTKIGHSLTWDLTWDSTSKTETRHGLKTWDFWTVVIILLYSFSGAWT